MNADYLDFSRWLTWLSVGLNLATIAFVLGALLIRDRRWVRAARNALILNGLVMVGAAAGLVAGFINGAYDVEYIANYSERDLPLAFKITGLWAGLDGSILFWAMLLGVLCTVVARGFGREEAHPVGRRLEPHVYLVLSLVQLFFLAVITRVADPFNTWAENGNEHMFRQLFPPETLVDGKPANGLGLNPLLVNYWMQIHPPCLYVGWVMYTIPFAYGLAALIRGEQGRYWIRKVRRWMLVSWMFNTTGVVLGGLWAYEVLGWGGYWAWDPVENASIIPWFFSTAFIHSIMVQERRDMMRLWTPILICLTFLSSIVGTWLTRSGVVSSVHGFSEGPVGHWFLGFIVITFYVCVGLVLLRLKQFRTKNRIESLFSREAAFVLNNMILVAIPVGILLLTLWPKISNDLLRDPQTVGPPVYNLVFTPFFAVLFFLTAVGPGLGWIRTSTRALVRNFGWSSVAAIPLAFVIQVTAQWVHAGEGGELPAYDSMGLMPAPGGTIYPGALFNYLAAFIITTVSFEMLRTAWARGRRRAARPDGRGFPVELLASGLALLVKNNRRYGGYIVHIGLAVLVIGVVNSSVFQVKKEVQLREGESVALGDYEIELVKAHHDPDHPVYELNSLELALTRDGETVASLHPEKRYYRIKQQAVREVSVHNTFWEDVYVYFADTDQRGSYLFTFYRNPLVWGLEIGLLIMLAGGLWAALPMGRSRVGLAD